MEFDDLLSRVVDAKEEEAEMGEKREKNQAAAELGRLGGRANAAKHGREHYQRIGKMGGDAAKAKLGREHYERIGKMGGARVREIMAAGRAAMGGGRPGDGEG